MKKIKEFFRYENIGLLYVLPAFIYMLVFVGYPIFRNIVLSFQDVTMKNLISPDKMFVGLKNYIDIFNEMCIRDRSMTMILPFIIMERITRNALPMCCVI